MQQLSPNFLPPPSEVPIMRRDFFMKPAQNDREKLRSKILAYPRWYHSFQLDERTKITGWAKREGAYPPSAFAEDCFRYYHLPEKCHGKSVLDIGGWDGAISFEMERRGCSQVVLVNPKTLGDMDFPLGGPGTRAEVEQRYLESGFPLDDIHSGGAKLLIQWFDSKIKIQDSTIYDLPWKLKQQFDIVLCLGLLYHLRDPVRGLAVASKLTGELLILETMCFPETDPLAQADRSYCEFLGGHTGHNWWLFNYHALEHMLQACGFERIERKEVWNSRCVYHAFK